MTPLVRLPFRKVLPLVPTEPMSAQLVLPFGLRSTLKPSSCGLPWLSIQLSRMDEVDAAVAVRFEGGASCDDGTVVLVVEPETVVVLVVDGAAVLVLVVDEMIVVVGRLVVVVDDVDVVAARIGAALATLDHAEGVELRIARTRYQYVTPLVRLVFVKFVTLVPTVPTRAHPLLPFGLRSIWKPLSLGFV